MTTQITFLADLVGKTAAIGANPSDDRLDCDFDGQLSKDGGLRFTVINGAWTGSLYETDKGFHLITDRGDRHEPIFVVSVVEPKSEPIETDEDRIPY